MELIEPTRFLGASETRSSLTRIRSASNLRDRLKSRIRALGPRNGQLTGTGGRAARRRTIRCCVSRRFSAMTARTTPRLHSLATAMTRCSSVSTTFVRCASA